jgi:hypothetical protein
VPPDAGAPVVVDGYQVWFLPLPTSDITSGLTPTSIVPGTQFTESTTNPWGATNPFQYSPALNGSEYDAIYDGSATYRYFAPQSTFSILWGTIDPENALFLFDAQGKSLGTLNGTDLAAAAQATLGSAYVWADGVNITVMAGEPFYTAVTASTTLTFEYSNIVVTPAICGQ